MSPIWASWVGADAIAEGQRINGGNAPVSGAGPAIPAFGPPAAARVLLFYCKF